MPTVFRTRRGLRVVINTNHHPPPHVLGSGEEARYKFDCQSGVVEVWDATDGWGRAELNKIGREIAERFVERCAVWRAIHG